MTGPHILKSLSDCLAKNCYSPNSPLATRKTTFAPPLGWLLNAKHDFQPMPRSRIQREWPKQTGAEKGLLTPDCGTGCRGSAEKLMHLLPLLRPEHSNYRRRSWIAEKR